MLTYYRVYEDIGLQGAVLLTILFAIGVLIASFLKKRKTKYIVMLGAVGLFILLEIGILLPTPGWLSGDGYAVTQEISLIAAVYLAPVVAGIVLCCVVKSVFSGKR